MKIIFYILFFAVFFQKAVSGQITFKTLVPKQQVTANEPFIVQYILNDQFDFHIPSFGDFRMVDGPHEYRAKTAGRGTGESLKNITYTLSINQPGRYALPVAFTTINGQKRQTPKTYITVAEKPADQDEVIHALAKGEDPLNKIRSNVFLKVTVNRKSCYIGEPVIATFKLYSALKSNSDIIKNPGFYGFTAMDMVSFNDDLSAAETINGKNYDVHTLRQVQLYPNQSGSFKIDPLEVLTRVNFNDAKSSTPGQQITEGVLPGTGSAIPDGKTFELKISSAPVNIEVNPYPAKGKVDSFEGATGHFALSANIENDTLARNQEGHLLIRLSGKGNFTQIAAPSVNWPANLEGFDSSLTDKVDKTVSPLAGERVFRYSFVATAAGQFTIPAVVLTYFDTDSNSYKTISTGKLSVFVEDRVFQTPKLETAKAGPKAEGRSWWLFSAILGILVLAILVISLQKKKVHPEVEEELVPEPAPLPAYPSLAPFMEAAGMEINVTGNHFFLALRKGVWDFLAARFSLSGSQQNKRALAAAFEQHNIDEQVRETVIEILEECERGIFTQAQLELDKTAMLNKTIEVLSPLGG